MGRQIGAIKIIGTFSGISYYYNRELKGFYVRSKSSLTRKRFMKDKAFAGSRHSAERFALGNRLASAVYKQVESEKRVYSLFLVLKKNAINYLKAGMSEEETIKQLVEGL